MSFCTCDLCDRKPMDFTAFEEEGGLITRNKIIVQLAKDFFPNLNRELFGISICKDCLRSAPQLKRELSLIEADELQAAAAARQARSERARKWNTELLDRFDRFPFTDNQLNIIREAYLWHSLDCENIDPKEFRAWLRGGVWADLMDDAKNEYPRSDYDDPATWWQTVEDDVAEALADYWNDRDAD